MPTQALFQKWSISWKRPCFIPVILLIISAIWVAPVAADTPPVAEQLRRMAALAETNAAAATNAAAKQSAYDELHEAWEAVEDEVKAQNPAAYVELESALDAVKAAVQADAPNPAAVQQAFTHLHREADEIAEKFETGGQPAPAASAATPAEVLQNIEAAYQTLAAGEPAEAAELLNRAIRAWPAIEGAIATQSPDAYTTIEVDLGRAAGALDSQPANLVEAEAALARLSAALAPFTETSTYTAFDAAAVILREGLEALLVIVALLAFLKRSGNHSQQRWVWLGGLLGILVSIGAAFGLQALFSQVSAGANREIIEGVTSLVAAAMLFYVSFWLHSNANIHVWQKYIDTQATQALARGNMYGLGLLTFLAVFREGAETTVFYLGMAPTIPASELGLGLAAGVAILTVIAVLMIKVGLKLPLRPFFLVAGLMVYYLGFKFLGAGIHALQVAGVLPALPIAALPTISFLGFYPSWLSAGPQLLLLAAAIGVVLYLRRQPQTARLA